MTELLRHIVRGHVPAEGPLVDGSVRPWVDHREVFVADAQPDAIRVTIQVTANQFGIAKGCRHQEIGFATAFDQTGGNLLPIADHVLRRCGFVIHVTRVNVGSLV